MRRGHALLLLLVLGALLATPAAGQLASLTITLHVSDLTPQTSQVVTLTATGVGGGLDPNSVSYYRGAGGANCSGGSWNLIASSSDAAANYEVTWTAPGTAGSYALKAEAADSTPVTPLTGCDSAQVSVSDPPPPPPECADGVDNDSDRKVDLDDPGCANAADNSESPDPPPPPRCADGLDNDGDGRTDLADPGCADAADNSESPDPDVTNPTIGTLSIVESSGFAEASGDTLLFNPAGGGTYTVRVLASDDSSGIDKVRFPDPAAGDPRDIPCTVEPCTASRAYRTIYDFTDVTPRPAPYPITAFDRAGNSASVGFAVVADSTGPAGGGILYADGNDDDGLIDVTFDPGSDGAGVQAGSGVLERQVTSLVGTTCGTWPATWEEVTRADGGPFSDAIMAKTCAHYRFRVADNVANESVYAPTPDLVARFDPSDRTPPGNVGRPRIRSGDHRAVLRFRLPTDADFKQVRIYRWVAGKRLATEGRVFAGRRTRFVDRGLFNRTRYVYKIVSFDRTLNPSDGVLLSGTPRSRYLLSPRDGAVLNKPPWLRWRRHSRASFYNLLLTRNGNTVLSKFPRATSFKIHWTWRYNGRIQKFRRGSYFWYLYPRIGRHYGSLMGYGRFTRR